MELLPDALRYRNVDGIEGLVIAIAQDCKTSEVLMVAFTSREGIMKSMETGKVHYYSTSRKKLWLKGETSGHFQKIMEVCVDCDGDAVLYKVEQTGAACHDGYRSCFYRTAKGRELKVTGKRISEG